MFFKTTFVVLVFIVNVGQEIVGPVGDCMDLQKQLKRKRQILK